MRGGDWRLAAALTTSADGMKRFTLIRSCNRIKVLTKRKQAASAALICLHARACSIAAAQLRCATQLPAQRPPDA
jgi:hypothetical protein